MTLRLCSVLMVALVFGCGTVRQVSSLNVQVTGEGDGGDGADADDPEDADDTEDAVDDWETSDELILDAPPALVTALERALEARETLGLDLEALAALLDREGYALPSGQPWTAELVDAMVSEPGSHPELTGIQRTSAPDPVPVVDPDDSEGGVPTWAVAAIMGGAIGLVGVIFCAANPETCPPRRAACVGLVCPGRRPAANYPGIN